MVRDTLSMLCECIASSRLPSVTDILQRDSNALVCTEQRCYDDWNDFIHVHQASSAGSTGFVTMLLCVLVLVLTLVKPPSMGKRLAFPPPPPPPSNH